MKEKTNENGFGLARTHYENNGTLRIRFTKQTSVIIKEVAGITDKTSIWVNISPKCITLQPLTSIVNTPFGQTESPRAEREKTVGLKSPPTSIHQTQRYDRSAPRRKKEVPK